MLLKARFLLRTAMSHDFFHQETDISLKERVSGIVRSAIKIVVEFNW